MRTPNTACILCGEPLYRRPADAAKARYAACMGCRGKAQSIAGITAKQQAALQLGRPKGTNHRLGYRHRTESKAKASASHKLFCAKHPELVAARSAKTRGERHYRWRGGASKLNASIRQMQENRRWMGGVRARDSCCQRCGSREHLESHHKTGLAALIAQLGITSRDDARHYATALWALDNGEALCRRCHYLEHGRRYAD